MVWGQPSARDGARHHRLPGMGRFAPAFLAKAGDQEPAVGLIGIVSRFIRIGIAFERFGKHQPTGLQPAPVLDPPLQHPQLAGNKHARMLPPQAVKEFLRCSIRLGLKPLHHPWPRRLERTPTGAPAARRFRRGPVSRPHFSGSPGDGQAAREPVKLGILLRHRMNRRARSQRCQVVLYGPNLVQEPERVQCPAHREPGGRCGTVRKPATDTSTALGAAWPSCREKSRERPLRKARLRKRGPFSGGSLP